MASFNCLPVSVKLAGPTHVADSFISRVRFSALSSCPTLSLQLHETLNLYVSPTSYVFEPASSSVTVTDNLNGPTLVNEKDVRESLFVDRRTGRMALNGRINRSCLVHPADEI